MNPDVDIRAAIIALLRADTVVKLEVLCRVPPFRFRTPPAPPRLASDETRTVAPLPMVVPPV